MNKLDKLLLEVVKDHIKTGEKYRFFADYTHIGFKSKNKVLKTEISCFLTDSKFLSDMGIDQNALAFDCNHSSVGKLFSGSIDFHDKLETYFMDAALK